MLLSDVKKIIIKIDKIISYLNYYNINNNG